MEAWPPADLSTLDLAARRKRALAFDEEQWCALSSHATLATSGSPMTRRVPSSALISALQQSTLDCFKVSTILQVLGITSLRQFLVSGDKRRNLGQGHIALPPTSMLKSAILQENTAINLQSTARQHYWLTNVKCRSSAMRGSLRGPPGTSERTLCIGEIKGLPAASQRPSQNAIFLSELRAHLPLTALPLRTLTSLERTRTLSTPRKQSIA